MDFNHTVINIENKELKAGWNNALMSKQSFFVPTHNYKELTHQCTQGPLTQTGRTVVVITSERETPAFGTYQKPCSFYAE